MQVNNSVTTIRRILPYAKRVVVAPIGDIHIDAGARMKELADMVNAIKKHNWFTFLIGDIFDVGFKDNVGELSAKTKRLNQVYTKIRKMLLPIKDRILVIIQGNHDMRVSKWSGFDLLENLSQDLDVPYAPGQALIQLKVAITRARLKNPQKLPLTIVATHGWGSGTVTAGVNKLYRLMNSWENVDCFVIGHLHKPSTLTVSRFAPGSGIKTLEKRTLHGVVLSAYQEYPVYAAQHGMHPAPEVFFTIEFTWHMRTKETYKGVRRIYEPTIAIAQHPWAELVTPRSR